MRYYGRPRKSKRQTISDKSDGCCWYCGCILTDDTRTHDHVIPRADGGSSQIDNLVLACLACNNAKRNLSLEEYRAEVGNVMFFGETIRRVRPANGRGQMPI